MTYNRVDVAMRELIASFSCLDPAGLIDRLSGTAAAVTGTAYAGFVRVDALRKVAHAVNVHAPPVDPLRVRSVAGGVRGAQDARHAIRPLLIVPDASMGEPGFLAMPVPLATGTTCSCGWRDAGSGSRRSTC